MGDLTRQKPRTEWTAQENLNYQQTGQIPESPEYLERRREVLENAGLEDTPEKATRGHDTRRASRPNPEETNR